MNAIISKYPRTPHLFRDRSDARSMDIEQSLAFINNPNLVVEEKLDGTCIAIMFEDGKLTFYNRGSQISDHPQYDLFKTWAFSKRDDFWDILGNDFIMYAEWLYCKHTIHYTKLPHYFMEFDVCDKDDGFFLSTKYRREALCGALFSVPVLHYGAIEDEQTLNLLMGRSLFGNTLSEGLYLKIEEEGEVIARAKYVRPDFIKTASESKHWQHKPLEYNGLRDGVNIWKP